MKKYLSYIGYAILGIIALVSIYSLITMCVSIYQSDEKTQNVNGYLTYRQKELGLDLSKIQYDEYGDPIYPEGYEEIINQEINSSSSVKEKTNSGILAILGVYLYALSFISFIICVIMIVSLWIIFKKAGKPGWAAIIPLYNVYMLYDISFGNGLFFLTSLIPVVNIVFLFILNYKLAKSFDKGIGYFLGLTFLSFIFYPLLAFSKSEYIGC